MVIPIHQTRIITESVVVVETQQIHVVNVTCHSEFLFLVLTGTVNIMSILTHIIFPETRIQKKVDVIKDILYTN